MIIHMMEVTRARGKSRVRTELVFQRFAFGFWREPQDGQAGQINQGYSTGCVVTSQPVMNGETEARMRPALKQKPAPVARSLVGYSSGR